ncbi:MAG: hypothetical protein B6D55_01270 [Candidatus Omnitrophica bacterium 4484_70.2]|nr:MAG: hypothetical protein B6D55_01270 [Candidatus Omnitrophica bacterium 4484_70.2]
MRDKLKSQPVELLQKSLHQLERENKKLSYQLEKERKEREESLQRLEAEKISLKKQLETQLQKVEELNEQFHKAEERIVQLQLYLEKEKEKEKSKGGPSVIPHKGRRVGIFIDVQNVYYSAKRHFGKKIDYSKLLWFLVGNRYLVKAICYIVQHPELNQESFINLLKRNGYIVRTRGLILRADGSAKGNWDIGIATDVLYLVEKNNLDIVVLVTCDGDFVDLVKVLKSKGIKTEVVGFSKNTAVDLKRVSDEFIEIEESLMLEN